jgi:predicted AAA+ superfamily ATPase
MLISRKLEESITKKLGSGKVILVLGPRQTGKTTLLTGICRQSERWLLLDCDDLLVREQLQDANVEKLKQIIGTHTLILIDEAQRVRNIGLTLKILADHFDHVQILVSGSSALELANEINEPLTGRKWEFMLYPVSWQELLEQFGYLDTLRQLEQRLIFGQYPEVITHPGQEKELLQQLSGSYLYKDLFTYKGIRKPDLLEKLLKALALQIGSEVSYNELAQLLEVDKKTVMQYLDLLEKAFVVFRLQPLSRNLRNEISSSRKIYFYDTGIRNALLVNFQPLSLRGDTGALWENFLIAERNKFLHYNNHWVNTYFWRTHTQQEIDYIEERDGKFYAFEFKWGINKKIRFPKNFLSAYPNSQTQLIDRDHFNTFLTEL